MNASDAEAISQELADLALQLERLAAVAGQAAIASACRRFNDEADPLCVLHLVSPASALQRQFAHAAWCGATVLEEDFQRLLRARRLVIVVGAEERLASAMLARLHELQRVRPAASVLTLLVAKHALDLDALAALQRRAWRTLVPDPPANPEGLSLASRGVLVFAPLGEDASTVHPINDSAAVSVWLATSCSAAGELDRRALLLNAVQLQSALLEATPPQAVTANHDQWERLTERLESKGVDRIERAFDEIDSACATEIRLFGEEVAAIARNDVHEQPGNEKIERQLLGAAEKFGLRCDTLVRHVLHDLRGAINDDCRELQSQADDRARQDGPRWPASATRSRFFAHLDSWASGSVLQIDDRGQFAAELRRLATGWSHDEPWVRPSTIVAAGIIAGSGYLVLQSLSSALLAWPLAWVLLPSALGGIVGGLVESTGRLRRVADRQHAAFALDIERHTLAALRQAHDNLIQAARLHVQGLRTLLAEAGDFVRQGRPTEPDIGATVVGLAQLISTLQSPPTVPSAVGQTQKEDHHEG